MNWQRKAHLLRTALPRAMHRHGFGIQSPWAYELIRDVLFEPLAYYAYEEQHLHTPLQRQLFRIRNHFRKHPVVVIDSIGAEAEARYEQTTKHPQPGMVIVVEHTDDANSSLWQHVVEDTRATATFDMGKRGMAVFDPKRIKQNYLL